MVKKTLVTAGLVTLMALPWGGAVWAGEAPMTLEATDNISSVVRTMAIAPDSAGESSFTIEGKVQSIGDEAFIFADEQGMQFKVEKVNFPEFSQLNLQVGDAVKVKNVLPQTDLLEATPTTFSIAAAEGIPGEAKGAVNIAMIIGDVAADLISFANVSESNFPGEIFICRAAEVVDAEALPNQGEMASVLVTENGAGTVSVQATDLTFAAEEPFLLSFVQEIEANKQKIVATTKM